MTTVTASNGWIHRPLLESDFTFWMESWKDYALSPGSTTFSYADRLNWFSARILNNETGTDANIKSGYQGRALLRTYVSLRPDGTPVGIRGYGFETAGEMWARVSIIHPTYRGNGYYTDQTLLAVGLVREFNITTVKAWVEESPSFDSVNYWKIKTEGAGSTVGTESKDSSDAALDSSGNSVPLKLIVTTLAQCEALKSGDSDWAGVTFVIS